VHRINGPDRSSTLLTELKRPPGRQKEDFATRLAEQLQIGTLSYASWRSAAKTDPGGSRRIAGPLAERARLVNAGGVKDISRRGRALGKEKASSPVPSAEDRRASRASLPSRYRRLDCYEFVAAVLEENGIRYYGKDGVGRALIEKAKTEHKPSNHFLTGEGLTRLLSSDTVTVKVQRESAQQVWETLEPMLKEGAILSFSSNRSGHTGFVGVKEGRWVFLNSSGKAGDKRSYRVKEEDLEAEIRTRLATARKEKIGLSITLGQVDRELAAAFRKPGSSLLAEMRKGNVNLQA